MQEKLSKKKNQRNTYIKYSSLASKMLVIILAGTFFGDYLDLKYDTVPIYTIVVSLFSIFFALYYVLKNIINDKLIISTANESVIFLDLIIGNVF